MSDTRSLHGSDILKTRNALWCRKWQLIGMSIMRPSIVGAGEQLDPRYSMQTYHPPVKQGLHPVVHVANKLYSLHAPSPRRYGQAELTWVTTGYIPRWFTRPQQSSVQVIGLLTQQRTPWSRTRNHYSIKPSSVGRVCNLLYKWQ